MAHITAISAKNAIATALEATGHPHPLLTDQARRNPDQLASDGAREHTESDAGVPPTFQAVNNQLIEANNGLVRLMGDDLNLRAAHTAVQYATEVIEEYAAEEAPAEAAITAETAVAQLEAMRKDGDENLNRFIDLVTEEIRETGDPVAFANWFLSAVEDRRAETGR